MPAGHCRGERADPGRERERRQQQGEREALVEQAGDFVVEGAEHARRATRRTACGARPRSLRQSGIGYGRVSNGIVVAQVRLPAVNRHDLLIFAIETAPVSCDCRPPRTGPRRSAQVSVSPLTRPAMPGRPGSGVGPVSTSAVTSVSSAKASVSNATACSKSASASRIAGSQPSPASTVPGASALTGPPSPSTSITHRSAAAALARPPAGAVSKGSVPSSRSVAINAPHHRSETRLVRDCRTRLTSPRP